MAIIKPDEGTQSPKQFEKFVGSPSTIAPIIPGIGEDNIRNTKIVREIKGKVAGAGKNLVQGIKHDIKQGPEGMKAQAKQSLDEILGPYKAMYQKVFLGQDMPEEEETAPLEPTPVSDEPGYLSRGGELNVKSKEKYDATMENIGDFMYEISDMIDEKFRIFGDSFLEKFTAFFGDDFYGMKTAQEGKDERDAAKDKKKKLTEPKLPQAKNKAKTVKY